MSLSFQHLIHRRYFLAAVTGVHRLLEELGDELREGSVSTAFPGMLANALDSSQPQIERR